MYTTFHLLKTNPFSHNEVEMMDLLLDIFRDSCQRHGAFLHLLPRHKLKFVWCPGMTNSGGVMGAWCPVWIHRIAIVPNPNPPVINHLLEKHKRRTLSLKYSWLFTLMPTVIHELTHMFQFKTAPVRFIAANLPIVREFITEDDADEVNDFATTFFDQLQRDFDHLWFTQVNKFMPKEIHNYELYDDAVKIFNKIHELEITNEEERPVICSNHNIQELN